MSNSLLIGELSHFGAILPVYVTNRVVAEALHVTGEYTGYDDRADRSLVLLAHVEEALRSNKATFSHQVPDPNWTGDPDKIDSSRIDLKIDISASSITIDLNLRTISRTDPRFTEIAKSALAAAKRFDRARGIL